MLFVGDDGVGEPVREPILRWLGQGLNGEIGSRPKPCDDWVEQVHHDAQTRVIVALPVANYLNGDNRPGWIDAEHFSEFQQFCYAHGAMPIQHSAQLPPAYLQNLGNRRQRPGIPIYVMIDQGQKGRGSRIDVQVIVAMA